MAQLTFMGTMEKICDVYYILIKPNPKFFHGLPSYGG